MIDLFRRNSNNGSGYNNGVNLYKNPYYAVFETENSFLWLRSEEDFRDEGVVFGLNGAPLEAKLVLIEEVVELEKIEVERELDRVEKNRELKEQELKSLGKEIEALEEKKKSEEKKEYNEKKGEYFLREIVFFSIIVVIIASSYFMLYWWIREQTGYPILISLSVLLLGLFSIYFSPYFLLDLNDSYRGKPFRVMWKVYFESFLPPLVSVLFLAAWGNPRYGLFEQLSFLAFFFVFFLIMGRLFFKSFYRLYDEWMALRNFSSWRRKHRKFVSSCNKEMRAKKQELFLLNKDVSEMRDKEAVLKATVARLERKKLLLKNYFETEYRMGEFFKNNFNGGV